MADTVDLNEIQEFFDNTTALDQKVQQVAKLILGARRLIIFTGAGISTAAKIPDFRGPQGVWTCKAKGVSPPKCIKLCQAVPTVTHRWVHSLVEQGRCHAVVSQNIDGLHRRSGVPRDFLSELHGNCFLEVCWGCGADFEHEETVRGKQKGSRHTPCKECRKRVPHFCHCSGNKCPKCNGMLRDSIIHFGENLPEKALEFAYQQAKAADLCIVLGSSLRVSPANDIPAEVARHGGKVIIVNLQTTPMDKIATVRIFAKTDDVSQQVASLLLEHESASKESTSPRVHVTAIPPRTYRDQPSSKPTTLLPSQLFVSNRHQKIVASTTEGGGRQCNALELFVDGELLPSVAAVEYELHPTFSPCTFIMKKESLNPSFTLKFTAWDIFTARAQIILEDGSKFSAAHVLSFSNNVPKTAICLQV